MSGMAVCTVYRSSSRPDFPGAPEDTMNAQMQTNKKTTRKRSITDQSGLNLVVVVVLGLVCGLCIIGVIALSIDGKSAPESLIAVASASVGGLVGLLVQTSKVKP
jgi:hypothetical protein